MKLIKGKTKYSTNMSNILSKNSSHWYNNLLRARALYWVVQLWIAIFEWPQLIHRNYTKTTEPSLILYIMGCQEWPWNAH